MVGGQQAGGCPLGWDLPNLHGLRGSMGSQDTAMGSVSRASTVSLGRGLGCPWLPSEGSWALFVWVPRIRILGLWRGSLQSGVRRDPISVPLP